MEIVVKIVKLISRVDICFGNVSEKYKIRPLAEPSLGASEDAEQYCRHGQ
jgi:hypothetical protein